MRKVHFLLSLLLSLSFGTALAQHVERAFYIDFGQNNVANQGFITNVDANGHKWNNIHGKGSGSPDKAYAQTAVDLVAADGEASGFRLKIGTTFSTNGYSNGGLQSPKAELLGDLAVATATQDYMFLEGAQDYGLVRFTGLDTLKAYRFHCVGYRAATDARAAYFTFRGETSWTGELQMSGQGIGAGGANGNNNNPLVSEPIFPDANGTIDLTISKKYSGGMAYLNCMKIEELSGLERPHQELTLAQKFLIDFGETENASRGHQTVTRDKNKNYWTNLSSGNSSSNTIPAKKQLMKNTAGSTTSKYYLQTTCKQYTNGIQAGGNNAPDEQSLGELAIKTATEDYMFIDNGDKRPFKFTGLKQGNCYKFYIYGTREHTDNRITKYVFEGQQTWTGGQVTSGYEVGGEGKNGNLHNVLITDYIYPNRAGEIIVGFQRVTGMAHISCMKIEEYTGGTRPEEPLEFSALSLKGNAEDVSFQVTGKDTYRAYARLTKGTYSLTGILADGQEVTLTSTGANSFGVLADGETLVPFSVDKDCVARITVDGQKQTIDILPVTLNVRGNIASGNPVVAYKGAGVWESEVTLKETSSQQWVDKTMYFAFNNNDALSIRRLKGAATRYALGMEADGQDVENIYQNAGTYLLTVDMANSLYAISAPIDEYRISVFGSSVANGQGATDFKGYRYLYGQHLIQRHKDGLSPYPFYTTNVSIGGNTTNDLLNRYDDLIRDFGRYVIFGLSLGNEGIHGASNQSAIFAQWRDNMLKLIQKVREDGKIPVVMNNYTRGDYDASDYSYVKNLNLLIHEWDVPSFNCLGAIDNGAGQWADGYMSDTYHQNTEGHYEFFYCMVPSLFDALKAEKPMPVRNTAGSILLAPEQEIYFTPEGTTHPFTLSLRLKGTPGEVARIACTGGDLIIEVGEDGKVKFTTPSGGTRTATTAINDDKWHFITLTSYYAQKRTILYVDKTATTVLNERLGNIKKVTVGGAQRELSEIAFWRSGMTPQEITAHVGGTKMLKSSLEIYAPLKSGVSTIENLAQSTNSLLLKGGETAIETLSADVLKASGVSIYDLQGRMVSSSKSLRPGIYVVQGRKVQVK